MHVTRVLIQEYVLIKQVLILLDRSQFHRPSAP